MFVDQVRLYARGGDGGAGVASFKRQRGKPRGKPMGGNGGSGGDVILEADADASTLLVFQRAPHRKAGSGSHAEGELRHGGAGDDLVLAVPLGTVVYLDDGTMLADLVEPGQRIVVAKGGKGGRGNASFVSPANKVPGYAEQGEYGEEVPILLELKLIADAALVGFPNAGKSTLIARVSAAKPKIADYPFTTLEPNLGVVDVGNREFVIADVPGLIEGAAEGKGLGHEFLRHVERAHVLVILLDPTPLQERSAAEQHDVLIDELASHSPELADRPRIVVLNKVDTIDDDSEIVAWAERRQIELHRISAFTGDGVEELMHAVADQVDSYVREAPERPGYLLHRPAAEGFTISRPGDEWVIEGKSATRAVNLDDMTSEDALDMVARRMASLGIDRALAKAGAVAGDDVRIGDIVFSYEPEFPDDEPETDHDVSQSAAGDGAPS
ncbi:MAG: GTPase ObgE [Acidimicrobiia bacterium]|nr:GTPase ObgE [Acidimicrobiia bacterium]NNF65484.1 GTPase ObgE [Acidimicrobiia bacterium]